MELMLPDILLSNASLTTDSIWPKDLSNFVYETDSNQSELDPSQDWSYLVELGGEGQRGDRSLMAARRPESWLTSSFSRWPVGHDRQCPSRLYCHLEPVRAGLQRPGHPRQADVVGMSLAWWKGG